MNLTELDWTQVLRSSYDDTTGRLKVDATVVATIGELEVIIRADQGDNIAIASPDGLNILQINPDGSIDANVAVSAAGGDSILSVGTEDGTTSGTQHVLRIGSDLKLEVKDVTVNNSLGAVITNQVTQIGQITTLTSLVSTANNQTNGQQKTQQVDAAGNVQPSADVISRSLFTRLSNGTTEVGITGLGEVRVLVTPLTNTSVVKSQLQDNLGNGITSQSILATRSLDVAVSQSALPTGASTSALQTTGNTSLNSIDTKLDTTNARLTSIDNDIDVTLSTRASSANQTNGTQKTQVVDPSGVSVTSQTNGTQRALDIGINVSGVQVDPRQIRALTSIDQVTIANPSIAVTGPLTDAQLRATPVPISGTVTATVAGVATEATLSALNAKVTTVNTGAVTISTPLPTGTNSIGQVTANAGTNLNTSALNLETTQSAINTKIPANLTVIGGRLQTQIPDNTPVITKLPDDYSRGVFGGARVVSTQNVFESLFSFDKQPLVWDETIANLATSTFNANTNSVDMTVNLLSGSSVVRQTFRRIRYNPSRACQLITAAVLGLSKANVRKRIGQFDDLDGLFFEQDSSSIYVVRRTSTSGVAVDVRTPQANWNIDKFDGTGPSGITIDFSRQQAFFIQYAFQGFADITYGFYLDGQIMFCHKEVTANLLTQPFMRTAHLPARVEITNTGVSLTPTTLSYNSFTVKNEGEDSETEGQVRSYSSAALKTVGILNTPVLSIRLGPGFQRAIMDIVATTIHVQTVDEVIWSLWLSPTLTLPTFLVNSGYANIDTGATAMTGGTELISGILFQNNSSSVVSQDLLKLVNSLIGSSIGGTSQIITLAARSRIGTADVLSSIVWREYP